MLRSNFFYRFFKHKKNTNYQIVKYKLNKEFELQDKLKDQIIDIDKKISENSKSLIEAQIVKFRSTFSKSNNFIEKIGENVYKLKLEESINWHQKELKELYCKRKELQNNLEKIQGVFWLNRIKRLIAIIFIGVLVLIGLFIFLSGFMILIYLMPLIILIILGYLIANKKY
tara:strand:- start:445 stop:957 length:513 start_codon:yes stop_codon:yes gene_type:complete